MTHLKTEWQGRKTVALIHTANLRRYAAMIELSVTTGYTSRRVAQMLGVKEMEVSRALGRYYKKETKSLILKSKV